MNSKNILSIVLICAFVEYHGAVAVIVNFTKTQTCPSNSSLSQFSKLEGAVDSRACFVECAIQKNCSVLFRTSSAVCYFGNSEQLSTLFSPANTPGSEVCGSHVRTWESLSVTNVSPTTTATAQTPPPPPSLSSSILAKLVIFFDFRKSYFNLMNPSKYLATPHGSVTRDSDGVYFPGNSDQDYIEVNTDANTLASTYLVQSKKFTIYSRTYRQGIHQTYHYFYDCSTTTNRGEFFDDHGKIRFSHNYSSSVAAYRTSSNELTSSHQFASAGVIFNGSTVTNFYSHDSLKSTVVDSTTISGSPFCLRLGYNSNPSYALKGKFLCYVVANDTLSNAEITDIGLYC